MKEEELKKEKPRGWANLQQQLKEVREESFKQGVWQGQLSSTERCLKIINEFGKNIIYPNNEINELSYFKELIKKVSEVEK